jgi:NADH:ubiquinone oxidoreductase subunit 6 (subunit J)
MIDAIFRLVRFLVVEQWALTLPLLVGGAALYLMLPRPQGRQLFYGAVLGLIALALAGLLIVNVGGTSVETVLFYTFSGLAILAGSLLITQHNPARAALSFALVILSVSGLFVLLAAPFLMAATIIIYAGAIVVTFLFVLMLAQQSGLSDADMRSREPLLASLTGVVLLGALLYVLQLAFRQGVDDLGPFLKRIHLAQTKVPSKEIEEVLKEDPKKLKRAVERIEEVLNEDPEEELKRAVERLWEANASRASREDLDNIRNPDFAVRLRLALRIVGQSDLGERTQDEPQRFTFLDPSNPGAIERARTVLKNYEALLLAARQRVGLFQPTTEDGRYQSGFSGPPPAATGRLRRDDSGRPESPAENTAHVGKSLFTDYLLPVELGGFLLLVAVVGSIAIAHRQQTSARAGPPPGRAP